MLAVQMHNTSTMQEVPMYVAGAEKATEPVTSTSSWAGATTVDPPPGNSNANAIAVPTVEVAAGYKGNGKLGSLGL